MLLALVVLVAAVGGVAGFAAASTSTGYDISYPQCNAAFPAAGAFSIVGVNDGLPYSANPCLGTGDGASELSWAGMNAELYANTADPGPKLSTHWPDGQASPQYCDPSNDSTTACAYDYGWNAAADSYSDAVKAYIALGWAPAGATSTPAANPWWLDVESANSWLNNTAMNVADLQGAADYLKSAGAASVGFYVNSSDWQSITGGTTAFSSYPSWTPGAGSLSTAQSNCSATGVTGGTVALAQYASGGFDGDVQCTAPAPAPALTLSSSGSTAAGTPLSMTVSLPSAATSSVTATLSTTSSTGTFSPSAVTIPAGSTNATFTYTDTKAGSPTVTASAPGYSNASQSVTVSPGPLSKLTISPSSISIRLKATVKLSASGSDQYGNAVSVTPSWSSPLGTFSPATGATTTFTATSSGTGTITATSGSITATASVTVKRH